MLAKFKDPILFKKIIDTICVIADQVHLNFNENGVTLQGMDDKQIALISMEINQKFFEKFECNSEIKIGVCLHSIQQILKCVDKTMPLYIKTNENKTKLEFIADYEDNHLYLSVDLIDVDENSLIIPENENNAIITMLANDFNKMITDLNQNGTNVTISVDEDSIIMTPDENTSSTITIDPSQSKEIKYNYTSDEESFTVIFPLRYLTFFTKPHTLSNSVTIKLSRNYPMQVEYCFYYNSCCIKYCLAPINNDSSESDSDSDEDTVELIKSVVNVCKAAYNYFKKS